MKPEKKQVFSKKEPVNKVSPTDLTWGLLAPNPLAGDMIPRPHFYEADIDDC